MIPAGVLLTLGIALIGFGFTVDPEKFSGLAVPMVVGGLLCLVLAALSVMRGRKPPPPPPSETAAGVLSTLRAEGEQLDSQIRVSYKPEMAHEVAKWAGKVQSHLAQSVSNYQASNFAKADGRRTPQLVGVDPVSKEMQVALSSDLRLYLDRIDSIIKFL